MGESLGKHFYFFYGGKSSVPSGVVHHVPLAMVLKLLSLKDFIKVLSLLSTEVHFIMGFK